MIDHKECRLGVCPIGKFAFSHEDAKVQKNAVMDKLRELGVDYVDIEEAVPDGLVRSKDQAAAVVAYLKEKQVDALFMPHCNFGTEDATGDYRKGAGCTGTFVGAAGQGSACGWFAPAGFVMQELCGKQGFAYNGRGIRLYRKLPCGRQGVPAWNGIVLGAVRVVKAVKQRGSGRLGSGSVFLVYGY